MRGTFYISIVFFVLVLNIGRYISYLAFLCVCAIKSYLYLSYLNLGGCFIAVTSIGYKIIHLHSKIKIKYFTIRCTKFHYGANVANLCESGVACASHPHYASNKLFNSGVTK